MYKEVYVWFFLEISTMDEYKKYDSDFLTLEVNENIEHSAVLFYNLLKQ
jgi:hypothetical protein